MGLDAEGNGVLRAGRRLIRGFDHDSETNTGIYVRLGHDEIE
jgi:hypothetical protein